MSASRRMAPTIATITATTDTIPMPTRADEARATPTSAPGLNRVGAASGLPPFGVEEEFLLLDRTTGLPVPRAREVVSMAKSRVRQGDPTPHPDVLRSQVEAATPTCRSLGELALHLRQARRNLALAAAEHDLLLAAVGAAPMGAGHQPVTQNARYTDMRRLAPGLLDEQLINGTHVRLEVPSREAGVQVMNRLRPSLHVLLALAANSPLWRGRDSGFASWRAVHAQRWPVEGPPPHFAGLTAYDQHVAALLRTGVINDPGMLYWQVRLGEDTPTVEVRLGDVALDIPTAIAFAGVVRGLVVEALAATESGRPTPQPQPDLLHAASWHAARHGLAGELVVPPRAFGRAPEMAPASAVLLDVAYRAAGQLGAEGAVVMKAVRSVLRQGTGADRQRRAMQRGGAAAVLNLVAQPVT